MKKKQQPVKVEHQLLNNYLQEKQLILLRNHQHRNEHLHRQRKGTSIPLFLILTFVLVRLFKNLLEYQSKKHQIVKTKINFLCFYSFVLDSSVTPVRSTSLIVDRRTPTIFKQKAVSLPITKPEKKKRQTTKDPMSIFDFYDDDENANGTIELRSSITTNDENQNQLKDKEKKSNRRSTITIENKIPVDALCKECSNQGTSQTMTEYIFSFKLQIKISPFSF
jgi:hypothetical protein